MTKRKYTLIELLTVIFIIAVLAGLIIPGMAMVRARAKRLNCASNLKSARVYISILGAKNEEEDLRIIRRLIERKSEIQALMSQEVILKYTPVLQFVHDRSVADGDRVLDLLRHMEDEDHAGN